MLTCGWSYFRDDTKAPTCSKRSVTHQTVHKDPLLPSCPSKSTGSLLGVFVVSLSPPQHLSVPACLKGLCGWSINPVIQGEDSFSRVNVCSQACRRDGSRPAALCLPWSLIRLEVNGGPCVEVAGARMEPPLTWRSHRGRTGLDHCDTC